MATVTSCCVSSCVRSLKALLSLAKHNFHPECVVWVPRSQNYDLVLVNTNTGEETVLGEFSESSSPGTFIASYQYTGAGEFELKVRYV